MKVLVVDDDEAALRMVRRLLQAAGHDTAGAANGLFGYFNFLVARPDLVITDIEMPLQNGFEMMKQIRKADPRVPAVYMSGSIAAHRRRLEAERRRYATATLEKPFSPRELSVAVAALVNRDSGANRAATGARPAYRAVTSA